LDEQQQLLTEQLEETSKSLHTDMKKLLASGEELERKIDLPDHLDYTSKPFKFNDSKEGKKEDNDWCIIS
jgi:hypothetical protein